MFDSMYAAARLVSLCAPQIGIGKKSRGDRPDYRARIPAQKIVLINPEIVAKEGSQTSEEGLR